MESYEHVVVIKKHYHFGENSGDVFRVGNFRCTLEDKQTHSRKMMMMMMMKYCEGMEMRVNYYNAPG
jgi:hypothetical protein